MDGDISYVTDDGQTHTHACRYKDCWIDVATGSAACRTVDTPGVKPFRTCRSAANCAGATVCNTWGDSFESLLGSPTCTDSVCDWMTQMQEPCTGGQLCYPAACATVSTGTTSGGFPWTGRGGSGGGTGGTGGSAGGASGSSGGGGASGGVSGAGSGGAAAM
jgi:uncharacterized membrane protein YgcG